MNNQGHAVVSGRSGRLGTIFRDLFSEEGEKGLDIGQVAGLNVGRETGLGFGFVRPTGEGRCVEGPRECRRGIQ